MRRTKGSSVITTALEVKCGTDCFIIIILYDISHIYRQDSYLWYFSFLGHSKCEW